MALGKEEKLMDVPNLRKIYDSSELNSIIESVDNTFSIGYGSSPEKLGLARSSFMAYELGCRKNVSINDVVQHVFQGYNLGKGLLDLFNFSEFFDKLEKMGNLSHPLGMFHYIKNFSFYSAQKNKIEKENLVDLVKTFFLDGKMSLNSNRTPRNLGNLESALICLKYCYPLEEFH